MSDKKNMDDFFKEGLGDFRVEPPKKVRRKLLLVLLLGKLFSGYKKYVVIAALIGFGGFAMMFGGDGQEESVNNEIKEVKTIDDVKNRAVMEHDGEQELNGANDELLAQNNNFNEGGSSDLHSGSGDVSDENRSTSTDGNVSAAKNGTSESRRNKSDSDQKRTASNGVNGGSASNGTLAVNQDDKNTNLKGASVAIVNNSSAYSDKDTSIPSDSTGYGNEGQSSGNELNAVIANDSSRASNSKVKVKTDTSNVSNLRNSLDEGIAEKGDTLANGIATLKDSLNVMTDTLAVAIADSISPAKKDSTNDAPDSMPKKVVFSIAPYVAMGAVINNIETEKYDPAFSVGVLGGVTYKNNSIYLGLAYQSQVMNQSFIYAEISEVPNVRSYYNVVEKQQIKIDSVVNVDSSGSAGTVDYDTTYVMVLDSSLVSDTVYTTESENKDGSQKIKVTYASIPLYYAYKFKFGKHGVELSAGMTMHFLLSNNSSGALLPVVGKIEIPDNVSLDPKKLYLDYRFAIGYSYEVKPNVEFISEIRYKQLNKNPIPTNTFKAQYLGGSLGVRWKFD